MPRPIFDREQYELRGHLPEVYTEKQKETLNRVLSRVNGQLDWNAQLLGFNGDGYWGSRIPTTDGTYKWKGLPQTVSEKRAVQVGTFGVYDKDKDYAQRPAPFRRDEVRASADFVFHVYSRDGKTRVTPFGQPEDLLYSEEPFLISGGEYVFDALVTATATNGANSSLFVTQDLAQGITSVRVLDSAPSGVHISRDGGDESPFLFLIRDWEDISDWTSSQVLSQFLGVWGNKGNHISSHFLFDALDLHGFSEEEGLSLDNILSGLTVLDLLEMVGLKPGPATGYTTAHYNFKVEDCDELYQPTVSQETKIVRLETQNFEQILLEDGQELSIDDGACAQEAFVGFSLETDGPEESTTITDNGTFEALVTDPPVDFLDNGDYPSTATSTIEDVGVFNQGRAELFTERDDALTIDDRSIDITACFEPPDPEFGLCETPNYTLTLRQFFDSEPNEISTDPGPGTSTAIGCNAVPELLGQLASEIGLIIATEVGDEISLDPTVLLPPSNFDDLVVDVNGEGGATLFSDPGTGDEIVIIASGTLDDGYDGYSLAFDGLELSDVSFEYEAKTTYGRTRFPCVEWVFDPSLDNSTYAPVAEEAAWMGTDDGEYDREEAGRPFVRQTDQDCVSGLVLGGFLSFDDGVFDEIVQPNCDFVSDIPANCSVIDGGFYEVGVNPLPYPLSSTVCGDECGLIDGGTYIYGQDPTSGNPFIDGGNIGVCTLYDNTEYDLVQPPSALCVAYDNQSYSGGESGDVVCVIQDFDTFSSPFPYDEEIDNETYSSTSGPQVLCSPCSVGGPPPIVVDCTLDNGILDSGTPVEDVDSGYYDRDIDPYCVPCTGPDPIVYPCPVDPIRVRLDRLIFSAPVWRMRPSVTHSLSPLRVWKNRVLNVSDPDLSSAFTNPLVADENTGPDDVASYRQFVRLSPDYQRNGKFWNRAEKVMANQSYFSKLLPPTATALNVSDELPLLYDEAYSRPREDIRDYDVFYQEDYVVSTTSDSDTSNQSGFEDAKLSYEAPDSSSPFILSAVVDYDAYEFRKLAPDGSRLGSYFKIIAPEGGFSGFLERDIEEFKIRALDSTEAQINDAPNLVIPNIEFPDDPDEASFSNYSVSYAYFAADISAADDPVFDPDKLFCHREKAVCKPEILNESITTEGGLELLTEDFDGIITPAPSKVVEIQVLTTSRYIFHDDEIPPCKEPVLLGSQ